MQSVEVFLHDERVELEAVRRLDFKLFLKKLLPIDWQLTLNYMETFEVGIFISDRDSQHFPGFVVHIFIIESQFK